MGCHTDVCPSLYLFTGLSTISLLISALAPKPEQSLFFPGWPYLCCGGNSFLVLHFQFLHRLFVCLASNTSLLTKNTGVYLWSRQSPSMFKDLNVRLQLTSTSDAVSTSFFSFAVEDFFFRYTSIKMKCNLNKPPSCGLLPRPHPLLSNYKFT